MISGREGSSRPADAQGAPAVRGYAERMLQVYRRRDRQHAPRVAPARATVLCRRGGLPAAADRRVLQAAGRRVRPTSATAAARRPRCAARCFAWRRRSIRWSARPIGCSSGGSGRSRRRSPAQLGRPWDEIDGDLFADVIEFHRLARVRRLPGRPRPCWPATTWPRCRRRCSTRGVDDRLGERGFQDDPPLRQAGPADAHDHRGRATADTASGFDGPASVLRETRRYGVAHGPVPAGADRLPRLADARRDPHAAPRLDAEPGPVGRRRPAQPPAAARGVRFAGRRDLCREMGRPSRARAGGWSARARSCTAARRSSCPTSSSATTTAGACSWRSSASGRREYLQAKLQTLEAFRDQPILLAVAEATGLDVPTLPASAFVYKSVVRIKDLLGHLS